MGVKPTVYDIIQDSKIKKLNSPFNRAMDTAISLCPQSDLLTAFHASGAGAAQGFCILQELAPTGNLTERFNDGGTPNVDNIMFYFVTDAFFRTPLTKVLAGNVVLSGIHLTAHEMGTYSTFRTQLYTSGGSKIGSDSNVVTISQGDEGNYTFTITVAVDATIPVGQWLVLRFVCLTPTGQSQRVGVIWGASYSTSLVFSAQGSSTVSLKVASDIFDLRDAKMKVSYISSPYTPIVVGSNIVMAYGSSIEWQADYPCYPELGTAIGPGYVHINPFAYPSSSPFGEVAWGTVGEYAIELVGATAPLFLQARKTMSVSHPGAFAANKFYVGSDPSHLSLEGNKLQFSFMGCADTTSVFVVPDVEWFNISNTIATTHYLYPYADNSYDLGWSALRYRDAFFSGNITAADPVLGAHLATKDYVDAAGRYLFSKIIDVRIKEWEVGIDDDGVLTTIVYRELGNVTPTGGAFTVGDVTTIGWSGYGSGTITTVDLDLLVNNGMTWDVYSIATDVDVNYGPYPWTIPAHVGSLCKVRVKDHDTTVYGTSAATFSIAVPALVTDQLIHHWDFHEGSGLTIGDVVGGVNALMTGAQTWEAGIVPSRNSVYFDGTVQAQASFSEAWDKPMTFEMWAKGDAVQSVPGNDHGMFLFMPWGTKIALQWNPNYHNTLAKVCGGSANGADIDTASYTQAVVVWNGAGALKVYINTHDTTAYESDPGAGMTATSLTFPWNDGNTGIYRFKGNIARFRVYAKALSPAEIAQNFNYEHV